MTSESERLIQTISAMRNEDLLAIVYLESEQYRPEALTYAKAEISRRGIAFNRTDLINRASMPSLPLARLGRRLWRARGEVAYGLGLMCGLAYFAWANFDSYRNMYRGQCEDCFVYFGFPYRLYQTGGFANPPHFLWSGLMADIMIAMTVSVSMGVLGRFLLRKMTKASKAV